MLTGAEPKSPKLLSNGDVLLITMQDNNIAHYKFDSQTGKFIFISKTSSQGIAPGRGTFLDGEHFYIINRSSNDISVLQHDDSESYSFLHKFSWDGFYGGATINADRNGHAYVVSGVAGVIWQLQIESDFRLKPLNTPFVKTGLGSYSILFVYP